MFLTYGKHLWGADNVTCYTMMKEKEKRNLSLLNKPANSK